MGFPDTQALERAGLQAWPGVEVDWDGQWVRRAANGYTKRANSLQCLDPADGEGAQARLATGVAWFAARSLPPVVRTTPLESPALTAALDAEGWQTIDRSHLYAMPLEEMEPDADGRMFDLFEPYFLAAQQALRHYDDARRQRLRALLAAMTVPAAGIVVTRNGRAAATGLMAIADGIVFTGNVVTDPAQRRKGLAAAMMRTGLAWARDNGATVAALNVEAGNDSAKALYAALGYTHRYDYVYRIPGTPHD